MPRTRTLRFPLAAAVATAVALTVAGPASAHIHTDPPAVAAGAEATVGFIVEHGCDGSPTTKMEIQLPDGATGISGVDEAGFTSAVDGQVVTFSGGSLADGTEQAFKVKFTAPDTVGDTPVKIIQTCAQGSTDWISVQAEGEEEPEHPAPLLSITKGAPGAEDTEHGHDEEATATTVAEAEHGHDEEEAVTTTVDGGHDERAAGPASASSTSDEDDDSGTSGVLIGSIVVAVVVAAGGGAIYARSRKST
ncbi:hypothetical protein BH10ACT1_BH10ACT1_21420 [soil metagenome]